MGVPVRRARAIGLVIQREHEVFKLGIVRELLRHEPGQVRDVEALHGDVHFHVTTNGATGQHARTEPALDRPEQGGLIHGVSPMHYQPAPARSSRCMRSRGSSRAGIACCRRSRTESFGS